MDPSSPALDALSSTLRLSWRQHFATLCFHLKRPDIGTLPLLSIFLFGCGLLYRYVTWTLRRLRQSGGMASRREGAQNRPLDINGRFAGAGPQHLKTSGMDGPVQIG